jgi:hypothetical protein
MARLAALISQRSVRAFAAQRSGADRQLWRGWSASLKVTMGCSVGPERSPFRVARPHNSVRGWVGHVDRPFVCRNGAM